MSNANMDFDVRAIPIFVLINRVCLLKYYKKGYYSISKVASALLNSYDTFTVYVPDCVSGGIIHG